MLLILGLIVTFLAVSTQDSCSDSSESKEPEDLFTVEDIIKFRGNLKVGTFECFIDVINKIQDALPLPITVIDDFLSTLGEDFDEYNRCKGLSDPINVCKNSTDSSSDKLTCDELPDVTLCIVEGVRQKFADDLNNLNRQLFELGIPNSEDIVTELKKKIEECLVEHDD